MTALTTATKKFILKSALAIFSVGALAAFGLYFYESNEFHTALESGKPIEDSLLLDEDTKNNLAKKIELERLCQIEWFNSAATTLVQKKLIIKKKLEDCLSGALAKNKNELLLQLKNLSENKEAKVFALTVKPEISSVIDSASLFASKLAHVQKAVPNPEPLKPPPPPDSPPNKYNPKFNLILKGE